MRSILQCSTIVPGRDQCMLKPVRSTHVSHETAVVSRARHAVQFWGWVGGGEAAEKLGLEHQTRTAAAIPFTPQPLRHMHDYFTCTNACSQIVYFPAPIAYNPPLLASLAQVYVGTRLCDPIGLQQSENVCMYIHI